MRAPQPQKSAFLVVGIWLSFLSRLLQTIDAIVHRLADAPPWLLNAEIVPFTGQASILAAMLHIVATGAIEGEVPRRSQVALGISVGLAVILLGAILATRPDVGPIIERARPWIGDGWRTGELPGAVPTGSPPA